MKTKFSRFIHVAIGVLFSVILTCAMFSVTSYAENTGACSGRILGTTVAENSNAGKIYFNSHPAPAGSIGAYDQDGANLSIAGLVGNGFAPADSNYAACVSETTESSVSKNLKKYRFEGYAWNTNLGFFSFYCDKATKKNPANGVACGDHDYGVLIGDDADGDGVRKLSGYGWNEAFGYINFSCHGPVGGKVDGNGEPCGSIDYGVNMDASGNLIGHAWSEAQVWIPFSGTSIKLPDKSVVRDGGLVEGSGGNTVGNWCNSGVKPNFCVEVDPDPMYMVGAKLDTDAKVADGEDGYDVHVFLKDADGVTPKKIQDVSALQLTFSWTDTVKLNQLAGYSSGSAVVNALKNRVINKSNFFQYFKATSQTGHYVTINKIASFAPTTNANISYTTSTKPSVSVENKTFLSPLDDASGEVWTNAIPRHDLILNKINFSINNGNSEVIYPEGKASGVSLKFKPAIDLETLYANDKKDQIGAYRNIPVNFVAEAKNNSVFSDSDVNDVFSGLKIALKLDYSKKNAQESSNGLGSDYSFKFISNNNTEYDFSDVNSKKELSAIVNFTCACPDENLDCGESERICPPSALEGATLYSEISYKLWGHNDKEVKYYSNKLPRVSSSTSNPTAVIHGNIYAPKAFSPSVSGKTQTTGSISVDAVRNSIYENIKKLIPANKIKDDQNCTITGLSNGAVAGCGNTSPYKVNAGTEKKENVLYFTNSEIHMNLSSFDGKWLVIVEGGNLYIDGDIYTPDDNSARFSAVVLKPYAGTCVKNNIYVDAAVRDVYANVVADCSVFSYDKGLSGGGIDIDTGFPNWGSGSDSFVTRINSLGKQLYWKGSIASRNTIGGADLDAQGSKYLLLGTGETVSTTASDFDFDDRLKAQIYDLNYLRTFKADIELAENGWPVDQRCGRALSVDDMIAIAEWQASRDRNNPPVKGEGDAACNGIDPTKLYSLGDPTGDLVPPKDEDHLSRSLSGQPAYDPVYVFYRAPESFIFTKGGKVGN